MTSPLLHPRTRARRRAARAPGRRTTRVRAALGLLVVAVPFGLGVQGTFAFWTDNATVNAGTFTSGTLDIQANGVDAYASTSLPMTNMVPGSSSAEIITFKNAGTVGLKYTLTGGLGGADAAVFGSTGALKLTLRSGATVSGSGQTATCTGGAVVYGPTSLTSTTTTQILAKRPTTALAGSPNGNGGTEAFCFQVTFDDAIASANQTALQNKTVTATFTAAATSDLT